ncbi:MAG: hypothetical protein ABUL71_02865 [Gemmatimonadota bacterium]
MTRISWLALPIAASLMSATPLLRQGHAAAQTPRTLDIGGPPTDSTAARCATDSIVTAALAFFNSPAAVRVFGGDGSVGAGRTISGNYAVFNGSLLVDGTVEGNVVVLNGALRIRSSGIVRGAIIVLGGRFTVDPGASVSGKPFECEQQVPLVKRADLTVARSTAGPSLGTISSALTSYIGPWRFTPHVGMGQYNRVEGIPAQAGVNVFRAFTTPDTLRGEFYGIVRTASDPANTRPTIGWFGTATYAHDGPLPLSVTLSGGSTLRATRDRPFSAIESGVSAFLFREDYNDWYQNRGFSIAATVRPLAEISLTGAFASSHQTTVLAVDAFSLLRNKDPWRPNPLIDDGKYQTTSARLTWDARDERHHPSLTWYGRAEVRHVASNDLTAVSLPLTMRDAMPTSGYGETEGDLDLRAWPRLDPEQQVGIRLVGGGHLGGDPMTIQNRRAIGGADPLLGYDFRAINCDRRRKVDAATPALCDRTIAIQGEYRRELPIELTTRIGGYTVGIKRPNLVLLADMGSAWLTGDSAGRVPIGKIQALREWRSDVGVGVTNGPFGLYLAKSLADALPVRLTLLFSKRF